MPARCAFDADEAARCLIFARVYDLIMIIFDDLSDFARQMRPDFDARCFMR